MGCISFLCAVLLVYSCQTQGSSAVTPVFVQKGNDVTLDVMKAVVLEEDDVLLWKFNNTALLVRFFANRKPKVSSVYTGRTEFPASKSSVILKNLQEADSGVYTAQLIGDNEEKTLAEYIITVQGPVSPVELDSRRVSRSSDSCNFTVTCSTQDSHINSTFRCDTQTCSQEGGERSEVTASGASLHVYLLNDSIICNHSNQASSTKDIKGITDLCTQHPDPKSDPIIIIIGIVIGILISGFIVFLIIKICPGVYQKKRKDKRENIEHTVYDVAQRVNSAQPVVPTNYTEDHSSTSIYSIVKPHTGSMRSTETKVNHLPVSL